MSELAAALNDTLLRLLPPPQGSGTLGAQQQLIAALTAALERGELGLNLEGPAPEGVEPEDWPARHLKALESSGWLVEAEALRQGENLGKAEPCEAVLVRDGRLAALAALAHAA